jgi:hypothetical protein
MERVDAAALVTDLVAYEVPVSRTDLPLLRAGLDELVFELGLTNARKSGTLQILNHSYVRNPA